MEVTDGIKKPEMKLQQSICTPRKWGERGRERERERERRPERGPVVWSEREKERERERAKGRGIEEQLLYQQQQ